MPKASLPAAHSVSPKRLDNGTKDVKKKERKNGNKGHHRIHLQWDLDIPATYLVHGGPKEKLESPLSQTHARSRLPSRHLRRIFNSHEKREISKAAKTEKYPVA